MLKFYSKVRRVDPEAQLQKAVVQHLTLAGSPGMLFFKIPNEGKRSAAYGAEMKRQGLRPGAADLCICHAGRTFFLELKAKGEKPEAAQVQFSADALLAGCDYQWADNIDHALTVMHGWGVIERMVSGPRRRAEHEADEARRAAL